MSRLADQAMGSRLRHGELPCLRIPDLFSCLTKIAKKQGMTLDDATKVIEAHLARMDELYGKTVFDEWAVVAVFDRKGRILHYAGPRKEDLQRTFADDFRNFSTALIAGHQNIGDFDFSRHAAGTHFDAFLVVGEGCFLICNNTLQSMAGITKDSRWLSAQVPFVELSDTFRSDPLIHPL